MNLDDLRRELQARAAEPGATSMSDRLTGVRSKVVAARRRKAVASGVAVVASLAVVGLASIPLIDRGDDDLADTDLVRMPESLNGDALITDGYNEGGESELSVEARLDGLDVDVRAACALPDGVVPPEPDEPLMLKVQIRNSISIFPCRPAAESGPVSVGPANRAGWQELGFRSGEVAEATVSLQQGNDPVEVPGAQFGVAFYEKSGDRVHRGDVVLTERLDVGGETYQLVRLRTHRLAEGGRVVRLRTPASDAPLMLVYGWDTPIPSAAFELTQDGELLTSDYGGELKGPRPLDSVTAHQLVLEAGGTSADGTIALAYYELVDD